MISNDAWSHPAMNHVVRPRLGHDILVRAVYESWGALCRHLLAAIPNIASVVIQQIAADTLFKQAKSLQSVFLNVSEAKKVPGLISGICRCNMVQLHGSCVPFLVPSSLSLDIAAV